MTTWAEVFNPLQQAKGLGVRTQQAQLGQAIIDSIEGDHNLVAQALVGTGKSFAVLLPVIDKVLAAKREKKSLRAVISTETLTLQDQYFEKDLPTLAAVYPGFTFKTLKGRSNYICFNVVKQNARGNADVARVEKTLDAHRARLVIGDRSNVEKVLNREIDDHFWSFLSGSSQSCSENGCKPEECYSAKARAEAMGADIVVVNHALLRVDADTRDEAMDFDDTFLGQIDILAVDEAHTLEDVLVSGWTEELTEWELNDKAAKIADGVDFCRTLIVDDSIGFETNHANEGISDYLKAVTRFFGYLHHEQEWRNVEDTICLKYVVDGSKPGLVTAMTEYEADGLQSVEYAIKTYTRVAEYLKQSKDEYENQGIKKGKRKITKGQTAVRDMLKILTKIRDAMGTQDGTVVEYGVPYVVTASGIERRNGDKSVRLKVIPLDVSSKAKLIWKDRKSILMSGTLMDLTDRTFRYAVSSLGFSNYKEISTDSPFNHSAQQIVYVSPANRPKADVKGAQFSLDEMVDLIRAANGRSLVLFTSKAELDFAVAHVRQLVAAGEFPWKVLAQEKGVNKAKIFDEFKHDTHSVLFASKSAFTGNDFPGETVSLVVIVKFPLPRFDSVCKQQIKWWRGRGFPRYYEMKALEVFHQAVGRLIRTSDDIGVVALLDQRAMDTSQRVFKTAKQGIESLGSPVTQDIDRVKQYLS